MADNQTRDEPAQVDPREPRRYSGKLSAVIILAIVLVFVLLNLFAGRFLPEPGAPRPTPTAGRISP